MNASRYILSADYSKSNEFGHTPRHEEFLMYVNWNIDNRLFELRYGIEALNEFSKQYGESYFFYVQSAEWAIAMNDLEAAREYLNRCDCFSVDRRDHAILNLLISCRAPENWEEVWVIEEFLFLSYAEKNNLLVFQDFLKKHAVPSLDDFQSKLYVLLRSANVESKAIYVWGRSVKSSILGGRLGDCPPMRFAYPEMAIKANVFKKLQIRSTGMMTYRLTG